MFESSQRRAAHMATLVDYASSIADGSSISWLAIEDDTKITMNTAGKALFRAACRKAKRPYLTIVGVGVVMSSADNAIEIVEGAVQRVGGAVRSAQRKEAALSSRHLEQMSSDDQKRMLMVRSFFGAARALARKDTPALPPSKRS